MVLPFVNMINSSGIVKHAEGPRTASMVNKSKYVRSVMAMVSVLTVDRN